VKLSWNVINNWLLTILSLFALFKASELQAWLLYYGLPCLIGYLPDKYRLHFGHLAEGVFHPSWRCNYTFSIKQSKRSSAHLLQRLSEFIRWEHAILLYCKSVVSSFDLLRCLYRRWKLWAQCPQCRCSLGWLCTGMGTPLGLVNLWFWGYEWYHHGPDTRYRKCL